MKTDFYRILFVLTLSGLFFGCAAEKPVQLQPDTVYEAELPERSMAARAAEDFQRHCEAANRGNAAAIHRVGVCYMDGYGVDRDEIRGFEAFRHAATLGHAESQYRLARCYSEGIGTEQNDAEALRWMVEAARDNHSGAVHWLADRDVHTGQPTVTRIEVGEIRHPPHHPRPGLPGYGPRAYQQDTFIGYQGKTTGGDNLAVGVLVRDSYDPGMMKAQRSYDKRREAAAKPEVERIKRDKAEKEQKKKDEDEKKKRDEIKAKKSS